MIFGYARISTPDQKIGAQIDLLENAGCEEIFSDVASGIREDRKGLNSMVQKLRGGDIVITYKNDRIFRSLKNMIDLIDTFNDKGVHFRSLTEPEFNTTSANGKFLLQIFAAVAEFERNLIRERTKTGLANARKRKIVLGRPKGPKKGTVKKYRYAKNMFESKGYTIDEACERAGLSKTTYYRIERSKTG
jgi:DNA invertase Pin-like site-specific DNA recombinase